KGTLQQLPASGHLARFARFTLTSSANRDLILGTWIWRALMKWAVEVGLGEAGCSATLDLRSRRRRLRSPAAGGGGGWPIRPSAGISGQPALVCCTLAASALASEPHEKKRSEERRVGKACRS